ncbi:hypothetical protein [Streptomyces sp. NPDC056049]
MPRAVHADNVTQAAEILLAELPHAAAPSVGTALENDEAPGR